MKIESTTVFLDIRDFTKHLSEQFENEEFYELIHNVYQTGLTVGSTLSDDNNFYINSTGDGFLCIFFGDFHYLKSYAFSLLLHLLLPNYFNQFFNDDKSEGDYWFGVGIESGFVNQVSANIDNKEIITYLGNVINIAARLESLTKDHARAPIIFGPDFNELLTQFYFNISYSQLIRNAKDEKDSSEANKLHIQMSSINSELLSSYLFEHRLKGVKNALPVFRVSPSLQDIKKDHFWQFLQKMPDGIKVKIKDILFKANIHCRY